jgi:NADPH2:quinone reductase
LKGCDIVGVFWGSFVERDPAGHLANTKQIVDWVVAGKLSAHVQAVYPLADAANALTALSMRKVMGKIVLHP